MTDSRTDQKLTYQRSDGRRNKMIVTRERMRYISKIFEDSSYGCYYRVEKDLEIPRSTVRYWFLKTSQERGQFDLHESDCGGQRSGTFQVWERPVVRQYIVEYLAAFPYSTLTHLAKELSFCMDRNVTRKVFF
jgi:hypothetical protein